MNGRTFFLVTFLMACGFPFAGNAQHSVARQWNEAILEAIRNGAVRRGPDDTLCESRIGDGGNGCSSRPFPRSARDRPVDVEK